MENTYKFISRWSIDTDIKWQDDARQELNKIIDLYNEWQKDHDFCPVLSKKLLANIVYGKQTIGKKSGGSGYWEELELMESHVRKNVPTYVLEEFIEKINKSM